MIYLAHPDGRIAACETEATRAAQAEERGFARCSPALHRILWQRKARRAFLALWPKAETAPLVRAVGQG